VPDPEPASDERMLVTLGEGPSGVGLFWGRRKNGSSFHELSTADGGGGAADGAGGADREALLKNCVKLPSADAPAGGGVAGGAGGGGGVAGREGPLKNCVKLPSADAESETPGEENPLEREGPEEGGAGRGVSSEGRAGGAWGGVIPETMIRVKSPGPGSAGGCDGPLTTCVDTSTPRGKDSSWGPRTSTPRGKDSSWGPRTCGDGSFTGAAGAGRWPSELNSCVNSPGAPEAPGPVPAPGPAAGGDTGLAGSAGKDSAGIDSFFPSCSNARRNIPVALSGSGCSGPEFDLPSVIGRRSCSARGLQPYRPGPVGEGPGGWGLRRKLAYTYVVPA